MAVKITIDEVLVHALAECEKAEKEYFEFLDQCDKEAQKWKSENDMYGWNFHQGMRGGAVWANLMFDRVRRKFSICRACVNQLFKELPHAP